MKNAFPRLPIFALSLWAASVTAATYPVFNPSPLSFELKQDEIAVEVDEWSSNLLRQKFGGEPSPSNVKTSAGWIESEILGQARSLDSNQLEVVSAAGRMPLLQLIANNGSGIICGVDSMYGVGVAAKTRQTAIAHLRLARLWQTFLDYDPNGAFQLLARRAAIPKSTQLELILLQGCIGYWPGSRLTGQIDESVWSQLYRSSNPVYRFIALEKFDSVEQSPAELLALYRECLFGACSYLEVRALEAIARNKDFREEVAKLLEEYIASNPPANDGTLPSLRNNFPNLIEGAKRVIATIRNTEKPAAPTSPQPDPFAQTTPTPKPPPVVQPPTLKKALEAKPAPIPSEEPTSSTPWSIIVVLIVAATGLLWLLLKNRK